MDLTELREFQKDVESGQKNVAELCKRGAEIAKKDPRLYRRVCVFLHSDKVGNDPQRAKILRAVMDSYEKKYKPTVVMEADVLQIKKATKQLQKKLYSIEKTSISTALALDAFTEAKTALTHLYIEEIIRIMLDLVSNRLLPEYTDNTDLQEHLNNLKNNTCILHEILEKHTKYQEDLQKATIETRNNIQKELKKHFNTGK